MECFQLVSFVGLEAHYTISVKVKACIISV